MILVSGLERGRSSSKSVHGPADQKDRSSLISAQAHSSRRSNSSRRIQSVLRVDHFLSDSLRIIFVFRFSVRNCGSTKHFAYRARENYWRYWMSFERISGNTGNCGAWINP
ncbi:uncharacterized protein [Blastocystis hominis]|uniref:Uncharacterized protein n=1 Tax=Blastocystis hominis TaxID=12968 RepID=D8M4I7_BLAHO|nr:uncharacterized protein [Blastocystis hominis]CBK22976.2 unnamed protein product [Blastocystis hominis]|eukprot:XP_012897024.1 uncharacterized protein [Blastocystis hominis]